MNNLNDFILINEGSGIAGDYYRSLKTGGSKKAMFYSFIKVLEPSEQIKNSLLSVSSQFWIEKIEKIKELSEEKKNNAYLVRMFEYWYYNKRRENQNRYERTVSYNTEIHSGNYTIEDLNNKKDKQMNQQTINTYFENEATPEEIYIQHIELGIIKPTRNDKRHYVDFPSGSISHWTYIERKKKLIKKLQIISQREA